MARPAGFKREDVLDQALAAFQKSGYTATSIKDLQSATGLKPGSIYMAFGSKREFFLETLNVYLQRDLAELRDMLNATPPPSVGLHQYFLSLIMSTDNESENSACYAIKTALELSNSDPDIALIVSQHFASVREVFEMALAQAEEQQKIQLSLGKEQCSQVLLNTLFGLRVAVAVPSARTSSLATLEFTFKGLGLLEANQQIGVKDDVTAVA